MVSVLPEDLEAGAVRRTLIFPLASEDKPFNWFKLKILNDGQVHNPIEYQKMRFYFKFKSESLTCENVCEFPRSRLKI